MQFFNFNNLQSASISFPSLVPRRSFNDRRLNEPPVGAPDVPRRNKNGRTGTTGRRCWIPKVFSEIQEFNVSLSMWKHNTEICLPEVGVLLSSPCTVNVVLLLPSDSLSGSCKTNEIFRSVCP